MDGVADTPEKMDRYIKTVYNKANDMNVLINELSLYSKIDSNIIPYNFEKININSYFKDCVDEIGADLEQRRHDVLLSQLLCSQCHGNSRSGTA